MGKYRDHRERRGRQIYEEPLASTDEATGPSYFQRPVSGGAVPLDAEVLWFNDGKGFGFVKLEDGSEVYMHARVLEAADSRNVSEGMKLKVTVEDSPRGRQIAQILAIGEAVSSGSPDRGKRKGKSRRSTRLAKPKARSSGTIPRKASGLSRRKVATRTSSRMPQR